MPWGLKRFHESGQSHFVTFCCYQRHTFLATPESKHTFELALERVRQSFDLCVYGYVVMLNHVHLLLSGPKRETLADAIKSLKQGSIAAADWRRRAFLAESVLRFQCEKRSAVCREVAIFIGIR